LERVVSIDSLDRRPHAAKPMTQGAVAFPTSSEEETMKKLAVWLLVAAAGPCNLHVGAEEASPAGQTAMATAAPPPSGLVPRPYFGPHPAHDPWTLRHRPHARFRHRPLPPRGPRHAVPPWYRNAIPGSGLRGPFPAPVPAPVRPAASVPSAPKKSASTSASGASASTPTPEPATKPEAAHIQGFRPMGSKGSDADVPAPPAVTESVDVRHGEQGILINGTPPVFRPMGR